MPGDRRHHSRTPRGDSSVAQTLSGRSPRPEVARVLGNDGRPSLIEHPGQMWPEFWGQVAEVSVAKSGAMDSSNPLFWRSPGSEVLQQPARRLLRAALPPDALLLRRARPRLALARAHGLALRRRDAGTPPARLRRDLIREPPERLTPVLLARATFRG